MARTIGGKSSNKVLYALLKKTVLQLLHVGKITMSEVDTIIKQFGPVIKNKSRLASILSGALTYFKGDLKLLQELYFRLAAYFNKEKIPLDENMRMLRELIPLDDAELLKEQERALSGKAEMKDEEDEEEEDEEKKEKDREDKILEKFTKSLHEFKNNPEQRQRLVSLIDEYVGAVRQRFLPEEEENKNEEEYKGEYATELFYNELEGVLDDFLDKKKSKEEIVKETMESFSTLLLNIGEDWPKQPKDLNRAMIFMTSKLVKTFEDAEGIFPLINDILPYVHDNPQSQFTFYYKATGLNYDTIEKMKAAKWFRVPKEVYHAQKKKVQEQVRNRNQDRLDVYRQDVDRWQKNGLKIKIENDLQRSFKLLTLNFAVGCRYIELMNPYISKFVAVPGKPNYIRQIGVGKSSSPDAFERYQGVAIDKQLYGITATQFLENLEAIRNSMPETKAKIGSDFKSVLALSTVLREKYGKAMSAITRTLYPGITNLPRKTYPALTYDSSGPSSFSHYVTSVLGHESDETSKYYTGVKIVGGRNPNLITAESEEEASNDDMEVRDDVSDEDMEDMPHEKLPVILRKPRRSTAKDPYCTDRLIKRVEALPTDELPALKSHLLQVVTLVEDHQRERPAMEAPKAKRKRSATPSEKPKKPLEKPAKPAKKPSEKPAKKAKPAKPVISVLFKTPEGEVFIDKLPRVYRLTEDDKRARFNIARSRLQEHNFPLNIRNFKLLGLSQASITPFL